jgi:RND superfamily putative drug exporter
MMMFAVLFGLSMDYEVFHHASVRSTTAPLTTRAQLPSAWPARRHHGSGRVTAPRGAFVLSDQVLLKVIGLGLATAVLLDAAVVRM